MLTQAGLFATKKSVHRLAPALPLPIATAPNPCLPPVQAAKQRRKSNKVAVWVRRHATDLPARILVEKEADLDELCAAASKGTSLQKLDVTLLEVVADGAVLTEGQVDELLQKGYGATAENPLLIHCEEQFAKVVYIHTKDTVTTESWELQGDVDRFLHFSGYSAITLLKGDGIPIREFSKVQHGASYVPLVAGKGTLADLQTRIREHEDIIIRGNEHSAVYDGLQAALHYADAYDVEEIVYGATLLRGGGEFEAEFDGLVLAKVPASSELRDRRLRAGTCLFTAEEKRNLGKYGQLTDFRSQADELEQRLAFKDATRLQFTTREGERYPAAEALAQEAAAQDAHVVRCFIAAHVDEKIKQRELHRKEDEFIIVKSGQAWLVN